MPARSMVVCSAIVSLVVHVGCDDQPARGLGPGACASGQATEDADCVPDHPASLAGSASSPTPQSSRARAVTPGPDATPLDARQTQAATVVLSERGGPVPRGAAAVGGLVAGQFSGGQSLVSSVPVRPGACYSVVAVALPPVSRIEWALRSATTPEFGATVANGDQTGPRATLADGKCLAWPRAEPGTAELVLSVVVGQGVALAQVYERR